MPTSQMQRPPAAPRPSSSPLAHLLTAYDQAIEACLCHANGRAHRSITVLRAAHPCDSPHFAGFDGLYAWCERAVQSGDVLGAARILRQLRSAWEVADRITATPALPADAGARLTNQRALADEALDPRDVPEPTPAG